jgi:HK97 family phage major capsid protein
LGRYKYLLKRIWKNKERLNRRFFVTQDYLKEEVMERANEMRQDRAKLINDARVILDKADEEKRDLSAEEQGQYDKMMDDVEKLGKKIDIEERQKKLEADLEGSLPTPEPKPAGGAEGNTQDPMKELRKTAFQKFIRGNVHAMSDEEKRALQADSDTAGGYTVQYEEFVNQLLKKLDDDLFIRGLATKYRLTKAESLGIPTLENDPADADWTPEIASIVANADSTMSFGKRELKPHQLSKLIKVSNKLIRSSAIPIESVVNDRMAYKFGVTNEKVFLTGHGSEQPLGLFTASADGISTGRDVSTGNTGTSITTDGLLEAKYTLKAQYRKNCKWLFHRDAVKQIAKLKDGDGQYIWHGSIVTGTPDTLLNFPFMESEYAPNTFTTGLYVGLLGDYSYYWIVDALDMTIQRLMELYAETNQVGFIGRMETDGMPVMEDAFVRVKLG